MTSEERLLAVRAALHDEPQTQRELDAIEIRLEERGIVLEGEVKDIAAKRLACHLAATIEDVGVLDRLRVAPQEQRSDSEITDMVLLRLEQESVFAEYSITTAASPGKPPAVEGKGAIDISVAQSKVSLSGQVGSLTHRRLADVLCWWVPGTADVDNTLHVVPPEQDSDNEISDALEIVLEKDPLLNTDRLAIETQGNIVYLQGSVPTEAQRRAAEHNAWYILGVHKVVNRIGIEG